VAQTSNLATMLDVNPARSRDAKGTRALTERSASPMRKRICAQQILLCFPPTNELAPRPFDQDFARTSARIVVGGLRHSIGPGRPDGENIARLYLPEWPIVEQTIPGFADGADNIHALH
jgi:hypothetical protein